MSEIKETLELMLYLQKEISKDIGRLEDKIDTNYAKLEEKIDNVEEKLNKKVGTMSGGQRQALTLLMATMRNLPSHNRIRKEDMSTTEKCINIFS